MKKGCNGQKRKLREGKPWVGHMAEESSHRRKWKENKKQKGEQKWKTAFLFFFFITLNREHGFPFPPVQGDWKNCQLKALSYPKMETSDTTNTGMHMCMCIFMHPKRAREL